MIEALGIGFGLGLAATLTPGPLATVVVSTALRRGFAAGARVSFGPVLTDTPVVLAAFLIARRMSAGLLVALGVAGGVFLMWQGYESIRNASPMSTEVGDAPAARHDLARGAITNLLNPHPWAFWIAVGAPLLARLWDGGPANAIAFLVVFYVLLVGGKVLLAWLVAAGSPLLDDVWQLRIQRAAGMLLLGLGVVLIWQSTTGRL